MLTRKQLREWAEIIGQFDIHHWAGRGISMADLKEAVREHLDDSYYASISIHGGPDGK